MKKSVFIVFAAASAITALAEVTATWTGAVDNYWTNAANWLVEGAVPSACPGVVSNEVGGVFSPDLPTHDRAVFDGSCTSGRTTIDLDGLYSISYVTVTGANAPKYTFGTDPATQFLPFETNGAFTVDASVPTANCPLVNAGIVIPANVNNNFWGGKAAGDLLTITKGGTGTLVINGDFVGPWFRPEATDRTYMEGRVQLNARNGGVVRFNGSQKCEKYLYAYAIRGGNGARFEYYGEWTGHRTVTMTYGPQFYIARDAIFGLATGGNNSGFTMNSDDTVKVLGEGTLRFVEQVKGSSFVNHGPSDIGRGRFEIHTKYVVEKVASYAGTPRIMLKTERTEGGRLLFNAPEPCNMQGDFYLTGRSNVEIPSTNQFALCPKIVVDARMATAKPYADLKYSTNVVAWTGTSAETFVTPVQFWGDGTRRLTLRNEGTAALTAGMEVTVDGESGNVSLKLDGATAPVIYGATLGTAIPVAVAGDVTLTNGVDLTNVSVFALEGGRLRFENASAFASSPVSVASGENAITVGGADVTVSIARTAGTLDIVRESDATVVCAGLAGQTPAWLTVNGRPATVDGAGRILIAATVVPDVTIAARGDTVPNAVEQVVGITSDGTGGNDVLAADETAVKGLAQNAATPATIAIGAAQTLTAGTLTLADGAEALTVGDVAGQGTLAAAEGGIDIDNQSQTKRLTVNAKVASGAGVMDVTGKDMVFAGGTASASALKLHEGTLKLTGSGTFAFSDLFVGTNKVDAFTTLLLENAQDVTYRGTGEKFTAVVGGTKAVSSAGTISKVVISNSTLRCDVPGYKANYDNSKYTNNTFLVGHNGSGIMEVLEGGTFKGRLIVGGPGNDNSRNGGGAVYQRAGRVEIYGISENTYQGMSYLGGYLSNAGYYELTGGEVLVRGGFALGINSTVGVFHQFGGLFCVSNCLTEAGGTSGSGNLLLGASNGAMGHVFVRNGTCDVSGTLRINQAFNSSVQSQLTASGDDAFIDCHSSILLANGNLWNQYVAEANVNLIDGGRLRARGFRNDSSYGKDGNFNDPSNHFFHVWFDRGTLELGDANSDIATPGASYTDLHKYGISSFLVGPGGAMVDTAGKTGNYSRKPFATPTNGMVTAVSGFVPFRSPTLNSRKMVGAPGIRIDGDGKGACAVALFDSRSQMVTNVVVTSGGTGYTWAKAVFFYWVGSYGTYQTLDCVVSAPESGSFTKDGEGDFTFQSANTYGGETVLKGGTLRLAAEGALPEGTVVAYEGGALESSAAVFPAELKVRIPGAENGTARSCTLATFTDSLPAAVPNVEVANAPAAEKPCWVAMFRGLTLRVVRQRGVVVTFR